MKKNVLILVLWTTTIFATPPINFTRPSDWTIAPFRKDTMDNQIGMFSEFGLFTQGRNQKGDKVSPLMYLYPDQNALSMLQGFSATSSQTTLANQLNVANVDGIRGHFKVNGRFRFMGNVTLWGRWNFHQYFSLEASVPFYSMKLDRLAWVDQTQNNTANDVTTKALLTNNFFQTVRDLSPSLNIESGWNRTGPGDIACRLETHRSFLQQKPWLKEVRVYLHGGMTLPTGKRQDEDRIMAVPFGANGAVSIPFGVGLTMRFKKYVRTGLDAEFLHIFGKVYNKRIKTDVDQTEFLLLQKAMVQTDYGFTQKFTLYAEPIFSSGLSFRIAYQYMKHGNDTLYVISNEFSQKIANTAESSKEWTMHNVVIQGCYEPTMKHNQGSYFIGSMRIPFNGKRSIQALACGIGMGYAF